MNPGARSSSREEEAIRTRIEEFVGAWSRHDSRAISMVFAEDADLINPLGRAARSRTEIEAMFKDEYSGRLKGSQMSLNHEGVRFLAADVAVADHSFEVTGATDQSGKPTTIRGHLTLILKKHNGQWQIVVGRPMVPIAR